MFEGSLRKPAWDLFSHQGTHNFFDLLQLDSQEGPCVPLFKDGPVLLKEVY